MEEVKRKSRNWVKIGGITVAGVAAVVGAYKAYQAYCASDDKANCKNDQQNADVVLPAGNASQSASAPGPAVVQSGKQSLSAQFDAAAEFIARARIPGLTDEKKLELYGLFKQSKVG